MTPSSSRLYNGAKTTTQSPLGSTTTCSDAWPMTPTSSRTYILQATEDKCIDKGLATQGEETFKFAIKDNDGKVHMIKVPNSLYIPDLRVCLLLPQN